MASFERIFLSPETVNFENTENDTGLNSDLAPFVSARIAKDSTDLYEETLEQMERFLIMHVLQFVEGNHTRAAEILGITRGKIRGRVRLFGMTMNKTVAIEE